MSKYTEAIESLGTIFKCYACDMEVADCMECDFLHETCLEALQIADRVSQIEYMEMPTLKIIETKNGVEATANLLETVDAISHNTLLAKIKGEEERIYARGNQK